MIWPEDLFTMVIEKLLLSLSHFLFAIHKHAMLMTKATLIPMGMVGLEAHAFYKRWNVTFAPCNTVQPFLHLLLIPLQKHAH